MLQNSFIKNIEKLGIERRNHKILLAVSGGIDSMVMANLFVNCRFDVGIAHCNFSLRGAESDGDEAFVEAFATAKNIPFFKIKFDTENYAREHKISIEMAARKLRYDWFEDVRTKHGYTKIAIAHNLNDVVETFFLNLLRGTGIKGLTGIAEKTETVIRPLLFASRKDIENYARQQRIMFRNDATNDTNDYTRNKIRHKIVPELEEINPSFLQTMQNNINHIGQSYDILKSLNGAVYSNILSESNDKIFINIEKLKQTPNPQFWLFEILQNYNFNPKIIENINAALYGESGKKFFSPTHILLRDRENLIIAPNKTEENICVEIAENTEYIDFPIKLKFEKIANDSFKIEKYANIAFLNFDKIKFPLTLRKWNAGDSFTPFGMRGKKKLSDFFTDLKLSLFDKNEQYVITSENKIAWVVNRRIDNDFKVDNDCDYILKITFEN